MSKTGYLIEKNKNNYKIADTSPWANKRKMPQYSKPYLFHIPASRSFGNFQPGDKVTVVYARSHTINVYDYLHISAICAYPAPDQTT